MSNNRNLTTTSSTNDPEAQFLRDLEEAKRLSLQTYKSEKVGWVGDLNGEFGNSSWKRTSTECAGPSSSGSRPTPLGFIPLQRNNLDANVFGNNETVLTVNSNYTKPVGMQEGIIRSQSFPHGSYGDGTDSSSFNSQTSKYPNNLQVNSGTNANQSRVKSEPMDQSNFTPSTNQGTETNSTRNGNLYGSLINKIESMTEDLIDLGQDDGKNVLEFFDPLFSKPDAKTKPLQQRSSMPTYTNTPSTTGFFMDPEENNGNGNGKRTSISAESNASVTSEHSMSSYGWKSDLSLYPTLPPPSSGLYDTLDLTSESRDQSMLYDNYNQFEYLYAVSISSESSNYWHPYDIVPCGQSPTSLIPLPATRDSVQSSGYIPGHSLRLTKEDGKRDSSYQMKRRGRLYENLASLKKIAQIDGELLAFVDMLQNLKLSLRSIASKNSQSYLQSAKGPAECWKGGLSLKIIVWNEAFTTEPVTFTSDVSAIIQLIVEQSLTRMETEGSGKDYIMRVKGLDEYLDLAYPLIDYRYVQECIKLDEDVRLVLVHRSSLGKITWAQTRFEDSVDGSILPEDILPSCHSKVITFADISRFLEVIDSESDKINEKLSENQPPSKNAVNPTPLIQTVKGVCTLLGEIQTVEIRRSILAFTSACESWNKEASKGSVETPQLNRRTYIGEDLSSRHSFVEILSENKSTEEILKHSVIRTKDNVIDSVRMLIEMYSKSFPVSFQMKSPLESSLSDATTGSRVMSEMLDPFLIRVNALHRIKSEWLCYTDFFVSVEVFHGTRWMGKASSPISIPSKTDDSLFFSSVIIDVWVRFEHLPICILPRECRVVFSVYGRKFEETFESKETVELGWASMQCFDFQGYLVRGNQLLPLWPVGMPQKRLGPAPNSAFSYDLNVSLITIEFPDFGRDFRFPDIPSAVSVTRDLQSLDSNTQALLKEIIENTTFAKFPAEEREVLWEKRHYLHDYPTALPKVLLSAQLWDFASLSELHVLMDNWSPLHSTNAIQLLLPCFPDAKVRQTAINWMSDITDEDLITVLPQLVEALSYETFDLSPLAEFLLKKSLARFEVTHSLFWSLASEVGLGKWLTESDGCNSSELLTTESLFDPRRRRLELMLNSLLAISYYKWKSALISEYKLMQGLSEVTTSVKLAPTSQRNSVLMSELKRMDIQLFGGRTIYSLPLSPAYSVTSLDLENCICFNSASVPLKINFKSALPEGGVVSVLYKQGDDIRQDMLTIQVIRMIEGWWLKDGLDLRVVTFSCVPTGHKQGVVEIVCNAETLCKIQAEYGVTGAFRNRPIFEWLGKMNPSTLDYRRAVENFTRSCAAYCVLTYILGICDRHNDNIMLTSKGHLFHIDFGKFLGDAQMFGSFRRDRAPFVLTSDMLYVINDGEKSSQRFHQFVELCCQAFKIVRQNGDILMNLFAMMATAGIPGVDNKSVAFIQNALLPDCSNVEAAARFTRCIEDSLRNWFTPVNFFIHSLAQLRFSSDATTDNPTTLSFIPKLYNMDTEGRIECAAILSFQKTYDPEKYYSYTVKVKRRDNTQPSYVKRSYKQFLELYTKLCMNFPMAVRSLKALPRSSGIGRSNVKQVAEKRNAQLQAFLDSLFLLADEISHSDLVYTFFHPLLQDEEDHTSQVDSSRALEDGRMLLTPMKIHGRMKTCVQYSKGALLVLVKHAFDLACPNGQPPSAYVKSYLQPDPSRLTKRKTRVVKRSQHPTFMEMIEYRLPLDVILKRTLQLSVWHHDPFQENSFLGGISIVLEGFPLEKETTLTYTLGNLTNTP